MEIMTNTFEQHLIAKYPELLPKNEAGEVLPPIYGADIPKGWETLVDKLCAAINWHQSWKSKATEDWTPVEILQMKSKFALLRAYIKGGDDYIRGMISFAEEVSDYTCEQCGSHLGEKRKRGGWIVNECSECVKKP